MSVKSAKIVAYALISVPDDAQGLDKYNVYSVSGLGPDTQALDKIVFYSVLNTYVPPNPVTAAKMTGASLMGVSTLSLTKGIAYTLAQDYQPLRTAKVSGASLLGLNDNDQSLSKVTAYTLMDEEGDPVRVAKVAAASLHGVGDDALTTARLGSYSQIGMGEDQTGFSKLVGHTLYEENVFPMRVGKATAYTLLDDPSVFVPEPDTVEIRARGQIHAKGQVRLRVRFRAE